MGLVLGFETKRWMQQPYWWKVPHQRSYGQSRGSTVLPRTQSSKAAGRYTFFSVDPAIAVCQYIRLSVFRFHSALQSATLRSSFPPLFLFFLHVLISLLLWCRSHHSPFSLLPPFFSNSSPQTLCLRQKCLPFFGGGGLVSLFPSCSLCPSPTVSLSVKAFIFLQKLFHPLLFCFFLYLCLRGNTLPSF